MNQEMSCFQLLIFKNRDQMFEIGTKVILTNISHPTCLGLFHNLLLFKTTPLLQTPLSLCECCRNFSLCLLHKQRTVFNIGHLFIVLNERCDAKCYLVRNGKNYPIQILSISVCYYTKK